MTKSRYSNFKVQSLRGRLLISATLILIGFLGTAGIALHNAFHDSAEAALRDRLLGHIYALLGAANEDRQGRMLLPKTLPDERFSNPESGLYALVAENTGNMRWRTPSLAGLPENFLQIQKPGQQTWQYWHTNNRDLLTLSFGIAWEDYQGRETHYTFAVAADMAPLINEIQGFRNTLWAWLGGLAGILLLVQAIILHYWVLKPLRVVAEDLRKIEQGDAECLDGTYPEELRGLTNNLNTLIGNAHTKQQRYRNSLDDLAHSLKTPLAILNNSLQEHTDMDALKELVQEQVQRMNNIVQHQLRRAVTLGPGILGRAIPVAPVLERLMNSLKKVYQDKPIITTLNLTSDTKFFGDEADLFEVLGNITDNAFKYSSKQVRVTVKSAPDVPSPHNHKMGLLFWVEDDGPGIQIAYITEIMQRGSRLDETIPGQGLGLAVAQDIVASYGGGIEISSSRLGGTRVLIRWPHP
ncbi:hypothetical protein TI04_08360 [Achromatium sp. WMS2]|nr:hypothetical protein TI04_08360 [Achromatium sp. WMS2]